MRGEEMRAARASAGFTQQQAAEKLGVSQAYLAMLERGNRPLTDSLRTKMARLYQLGPVALPLVMERTGPSTSESLARDVASLGYPGFQHLRRRRKQNPAQVLLSAITADDLEVRVIESLPWLIAKYSDLDWDWLIREAKVRDAQNRLGFLVAIAARLAGRRADDDAAARLERVEQTLESARLVREDTLCQSPLSAPELKWLRQQRSPLARHWRLLTDLSVEDLSHAA